MKKLILIAATIFLLGVGCGRPATPAQRAAEPRPAARSPQKPARIRTCAEFEASLGYVPKYDEARQRVLNEAVEVEKLAGKETVEKFYEGVADALKKYQSGTHGGLQPANFPLPPGTTLCGLQTEFKAVTYVSPLGAAEKRAFFERELPAHGFPISSIAGTDKGLPRGVVVIYFSKGGITITEHHDTFLVSFH